MKALQKYIRDSKALVFIDLEGTQYTHEMIEIGAHVVLIDDNYRVRKILKGFQTYVKAHGQIGKVVVDLTGITQKTLNEKGVSFTEAMYAFKSYVGKYWDKCRFVTFGGHDIVIFNSSLDEAPVNENLSRIIHAINRYNFDFATFLANYIQDQNGNQLSLSNYLKTFNLEFEGTKHDALADAYNTIIVYKAFLEQKGIVSSEYKKTLSHLRRLPTPIKMVLDKLTNGETVTPEEYNAAIEDSIQ